MLDWQDIQIFLEVARSQRLTDAARRLGVDHSTLSRRTRRFEQTLNTQLFERSTHGYHLTEAGHQLLAHAEEMARHAFEAGESLTDKNHQISGQIRLGVTEGFGTWVIAPLLSAFCARHPGVTLDLLALPRVVNLSRHEADLAITIERPVSPGLVNSRLCDYRLRLYGSRDYLASHGTPKALPELAQHRLIGYVDDLIFSEQLSYLEPLLDPAVVGHPGPHFAMRSTSVTTQHAACLHGAGLAVLPCFIASTSPALGTVLDDEVDVVRQFWITARQEQRRLARVRVLWDFLREALETNHDFLMGEAPTLTIPGNA
ncbi:LysR family transcriptional regulator [Halomonas urumqiensis]|uniref:LysR family transcriptional regulator n=1 Tax=Halomonas urumqiensis TaxID=1684789 RepID=A0A2N7UMK8_9GAMM|nr:LysR family transcriptional regulator [Halomonas urumqiensis]PMR81639.1 LysR family transcriptional regulator [Halomonas urumqiensis]PTB02276.1 LysR family transcriptional regulator [Halomonas urumqiensis]GHE21744.1 LysR family transcriptional regulator [Halomonas urumqiensis]